VRTPIRYRQIGERDGDPVVLVHGLAGSSRWWDPVARALATRHRVYLVDLPGFGEWRPRRFILREAPAALARWMAHAGVPAAHVVGHSMGGLVAARLAAAWPERVHRLVLVAPAGVPSGRGMLHHVAPLVAAVSTAPARFLPTLVADAARAGPLTTLRAARDLLADDVRRDLHAIAAPTLVVLGDRDRLVPPALGAVFAHELRDARLLVLEDTGHVPMAERPRELGGAMLEFLANGRPAR
jgi:pimeloyl-ACP methyl ester carboxylesterase